MLEREYVGIGVCASGSIREWEWLYLGVGVCRS